MASELNIYTSNGPESYLEACDFYVQDYLTYPIESMMIEIIPKRSYEIVNVRLFNSKKRKIDISRLGTDTRELYFEMEGKSCEIISDFPPNLEILSIPNLVQKNSGHIPDTLQVLCTKTIAKDFSLPKNLRKLICVDPPNTLPLYLTHFIYRGNYDQLVIPESVTHLCSIPHSPGNYPLGLKSLRIGYSFLAEHSDLRNMFPNLESLGIIRLPGGISGCLFGKFEVSDLDAFFSDISDSTGYVLHGNYRRAGISECIRLPATLRELYIDISSIPDRFDYKSLVNLRKLKCLYCKGIDLPDSLESLYMYVDDRSTFWTDMDEFNSFINCTRNIKRLFLPKLSELVFEQFCDRNIVENLYLCRSNPYDISMIRSNVTISNFTRQEAPQSTGIICVVGEIMRSDWKDTYDYVGSDEILDVFERPLDVVYLTHRDLYVNRRAKSARK